MSFEQYLVHPVFKSVSDIVREEGTEAYVIGGYVRDLLLYRESNDIDIVVLKNGIETAQKVAEAMGCKGVTVFKHFGTAMFLYDGIEIEFVGARKESYSADSRKPAVENGTLEDDQRRRDFTINALAISLNHDSYGEMIDPFNGLDDLENRIIRTPLDPDITFSDDPLRMFRAIRFASQLNFTIDEETFEAIKRNADRISILSMERISTEFNKIMLSPEPSKGIYLLDDSGLLKRFFPELAALKGRDSVNGTMHKDIFDHTLAVLDRVALKTDDLWIRWGALLHDIGKPATKRFVEGQGWTFYGHNVVGAKMVKRIFNRLKLPQNEKMRVVEKLVELHMRPIVLSEEEVTDSAVRRLLFEAGDDIEAIMMLAEADITSKQEERVKRYLANYKIVREKLKDVEERDSIRNFQPPIDGAEIMEIFNIPPCRMIGDIKNAIKEAILDGKIGNNREEAYHFMVEVATTMGLKPVTTATGEARGEG